MSDVSWLLGEQWQISPEDLRAEANGASLFISAPTGCERSSEIERLVRGVSLRKVAIFFSAYERQFPSQIAIGAGVSRRGALKDEWELVDVEEAESLDYVRAVAGIIDAVGPGQRVLVDITGFPVSGLGFLVRVLQGRELDVTWLYAEPLRYISGSDTTFAAGLKSVSPIRGFAATAVTVDEGAVVFFAGYDADGLRAVADYRKGADPRYLVVPFPPFQIQMYQEGVLRIEQARDSIGVRVSDPSRAFRVGAYDVCGAMAELDGIFRKEAGRVFTVAPLSTKAHALGVFSWWSRLNNADRERVSIVVPRYAGLHSGVSEGLGRIWRYRLIPVGADGAQT